MAGLTQSLPNPRRKVGKYEIVDKIGEGGYSHVYRGFDPLIKREVAIKSCSSSDQETRDRFYREAEIAGNLDHPNIVRVYDLFLDDGTPYLVQELLDGEDLDEKIERYDVTSFGERLYTLIQIARGLDYAHRRGVVHRDVKPANVRILEDGTAKILDFGIAKLVHHNSDLTRAGMTVGTAAYLAPEQIRGEDAGPATDVFSFGVLAYELMTHTRPFGRETISETFYQTLNHDPEPLTTHWPNCPAGLVTVVARCLQKDPANRYKDFGEVLRALEQLRDRMRDQQKSGENPSKTQLISTDHEIPLTHDESGPTHTAVSSATLRIRTSDHVDLPLQARPTGMPVAGATQRRRRRGPWILVAILAIVAAASWSWLPDSGLFEKTDRWLSDFGSRSPAPAVVGDKAPGVQPSADPSTSASVAEPEVPPPAEEPASPSESEPVPVPAHEPEVETPPVATDPAVAETPPSAAALELATVSFKDVWSTGIRLSIDGGTPQNLGRSQEIQLEPGPHSLTFSIDADGYRTSRSTRIRVAAGEKTEVQVPIAPPGRLTVQAQLGSPQGLVRVGTQRLLRPTPLRGLRVSPGRHQLTIFSHEDRTAPRMQTVVDLRAGVEAVVTFDLENQVGPQVREREISP